MSQNTLDRYRDVVVVNADHIALALSLELKKQPLSVQRDAFGGSNLGGYLYMYRSDQHPDKVLESVVSAFGDSITSLYMNNRIFGSVGELITARETLIKAIAEKVGLSPAAVGIEDSSRGRSLNLCELSTGQLIDTLAERMGSSIVVTNNHSAAGVAGLSLA